MNTPTELVQYDNHRWIDPLAVREIKLMPPTDGKVFRVLVMRDGTHTGVDCSTPEAAEEFVSWMTARVNAARKHWAAMGVSLNAQVAKPE